jgi:hypothetical protein
MKLFTAAIANVCNKLECLSLSGLFSLVKILEVRLWYAPDLTPKTLD